MRMRYYASLSDESCHILLNNYGKTLTLVYGYQYTYTSQNDLASWQTKDLLVNSPVRPSCMH